VPLSNLAFAEAGRAQPQFATAAPNELALGLSVFPATFAVQETCTPCVSAFDRFAETCIVTPNGLPDFGLAGAVLKLVTESDNGAIPI
jgi:hypothetical protein